MKLQVPHEVLEKAIRRRESERAQPERAPAAVRPARVITISRLCGSGGKSIAGIVGERIGWTVWDSEILNVLADRSHGHYQARMFEMLDERTQGTIELNFLACLGELDQDTYIYLLNKAIFTIAQHDGIIVGRGADILLPGAFRVRIKASVETRVRHMMSRWNLSEGETYRKIKRVDRERVAFRKKLARARKRTGASVDLLFDLEINTDRISFEAGAEAVCAGARSFFHMDG
jgi:hypothetical protein